MGTAIMMAGTSTGGTEAIANIDCPMNGNLVGIEWAGRAIIDTTADFQDWQCSFGSTAVSANDSRQVISNVSVGNHNFLTSVGDAVGRISQFTPLPAIPVGMGERIFLHSIAAAGVVGQIRATLHFDFDLDKVQVRRR